MAIRNLTPFNDPQFRKKSRPVTAFDEKLWVLLEDMFDTLKKAKGYGCAAVHVGILRRVVVIHDENNVIELINPEITHESDEKQTVMESSIAPNAPHGSYVFRPKEVTVSAFDRNGKTITLNAKGFLAATLCHEIDHLDGILYTDKIINGGKP